MIERAKENGAQRYVRDEKVGQHGFRRDFFEIRTLPKANFFGACGTEYTSKRDEECMRDLHFEASFYAVDCRGSGCLSRALSSQERK